MLPQQCEWWLIYSLIVAGKSASFTERVMARLFPDPSFPFVHIRSWDEQRVLRERLEQARTGNYSKLERALCELAVWPTEANRLDLRTCTVEDLEAISGIGPKTARFFLLQTRSGVRVAALDTHVLKWMAKQGYPVPKQTPQNARYRIIEEAFLFEADRRGLTPKELDAKIWESYRRAW